MRMEGELRSDLEWEVITSQIPSKKNQYQIGNNKHGERYIIKSEKVGWICDIPQGYFCVYLIHIFTQLGS